MTLREILQALDELTSKELHELREELDQRAGQAELHAGTMDVDALLNALDALTDGLTKDDISTMIAAMNDEYIEPTDDNQWRD